MTDESYKNLLSLAWDGIVGRYTNPIADQRTHRLAHQLTLRIFSFPEVHCQIEHSCKMEEKLHLEGSFVAVLYMADRIQAPRECRVRALLRVFLLVLHLDYPNRFSSSPTMTLNSNVVQLSRRRFPPVSFGPHIKTCLAFSSERSYLFKPLVYSNLTPLGLVVGLEEFKLSFTDTGAWLWQFILTPQCSFLSLII